MHLEWIYVQSPSSQDEQINSNELILPSPDILQQLYHLSMMGDVSAMEAILRDITEQNSQLTAFAGELNKLTATFQTGKIRKFLKSLITTESHS